jgi:DNA-cytosine methyltransferase
MDSDKVNNVSKPRPTRSDHGPQTATALRALDLFSGAGGMSCGFEWMGGVVCGGIDNDASAAATFQRNHPDAKVWAEDIRKLDARQVHDAVGDVDVILGGPMCQGVSQRGPRDPRDARNFAFWAFAQYIREFRPRYFLMENVPALASDVHNRRLAIAVFEELESLGYHLAADVVNAAWLGVPQLRHRCVVMGGLAAQPRFPNPVARGIAGQFVESEFITVDDAIMDLPVVAAGGGSDDAPLVDSRAPLSIYAMQMRAGADRLHNHWSADTDNINLDRINLVPEGGNWHDVPPHLLPARFQEVRPSDHTTTYGRLHRGHPSYTITTECGNVTSGAYTHPTQHRAITVREAARLQGFPDRFAFCGPRGAQYKQVGNAVPPLMARRLLESLLLGRDASDFVGRLSASVLAKYPRERLPFTLAPRYRPLFGRSTGAARRSAAQMELPATASATGTSRG